MAILQGTVSLFNDIHGTGIIEPGNGAERIKFTYKDVKNKGFTMPFEGQQVEFEIVKTEKGPRTRNIVLIDDDTTQLQ